jgi:hypothetical protein
VATTRSCKLHFMSRPTFVGQEGLVLNEKRSSRLVEGAGAARRQRKRWRMDVDANPAKLDPVDQCLQLQGTSAVY